MKSILFFFFTTFLFAGNTHFSPQQGQQVESPAIWDGDRCRGLEIYKKLPEYKRGEITWEQFKAFEAKERQWIKDSCVEKHADVCVDRKLQMNQEGDYWVFRVVEYNKQCKPLPDPKEAFRIKAPEENIYSGNLLYASISVLVNLKDPSNSILPFSTEDNYAKWQHREAACEPPGECSSADCFYCKEHPEGNKLSQEERKKVCPNYVNFLKRVEQIKNSDCEFRVIIPSKISHKVYLVTQKQSSILELKEMDSDWFDTSYIKNNFTSNLNEWMNYLEHLAIIVANDPGCHFQKKPERKSLWAIIKGNINNYNYILGAGFPAKSSGWTTFIPFDTSKGGITISRKIMNALSDDSRVITMIKEKFTQNKTSFIIEVLPSVWAAENNPLQSVSGATTKKEFYNKLLAILDNKPALDFLMRDSSGLFVWKTSGYKKELKELSACYYQPFIEMQAFLVIADPGLQVFAEDTDKGKWLFFFKGKDLWSWAKGTNNFNQYVLLSLGTLLNFTGDDCKKYLNALMQRAGPYEKTFFLEYATNPDGFKLADIFFLENNFRIVLYLKTGETRQDYQIVNRLSNDEDTVVYNPFKLYTTGAGNLQDMYTHEWKRDILEKKFITEKDSKEMELWLSKSYFGFYRNKNVSVYLQCKSYEDISFRSVSANISEIYHLKKDVTIDHKLLFSNWLADKWDNNVWRANPVGCLEETIK